MCATLAPNELPDPDAEPWRTALTGSGRACIERGCSDRRFVPPSTATTLSRDARCAVGTEAGPVREMPVDLRRRHDDASIAVSVHAGTRICDYVFVAKCRTGSY
jgi:hypothetical protein